MSYIQEYQKVKKVILLGSGGLSIGQAGEFDYSGTQAVESLIEEGVEIIIINPNIATVQTNPRPGAKVYLYPINKFWLEKIIDKERPDAIIGSFGGQTAINCLVDLDESGILERYQVKNLGTSVATLKLTEDRDLFAEKMKDIGIPVPPSSACETIKEACEAAKNIGYPVIVRAAYALGGLGSGFAHDESELQNLVGAALATSPQVLIEKSLKGWKEVEYEVMRDSFGNGICICNMENFDALGIHTGDSIVVAPSQTLTDEEYQMLRNASLKMIHHLKIVGECNAQFALSPNSQDFYVIEVNARLSRSSALASKASGYPIARIAAKVILGKSLIELKNPVTGITSAFYEPALDYITIKVPKWDLKKFVGAHKYLDSTMKSVGEVMAIGRNFPETIQKAIRMVTENSLGLSAANYKEWDIEKITEKLEQPTESRIFAIMKAFQLGMPMEKIYEYSYIDPWFLSHLKEISNTENEITDLCRIQYCDSQEESYLLAIDSLSRQTLQKWKKNGFSDDQISFLAQYNQKGKLDKGSLVPSQKIHELALLIRSKRIEKGVVPVVKKIDTTSGEFPSPSNYLYLTYQGDHHDELEPISSKKIMILGGGAYRIGASVEFDWCAVTCSKRIREVGFASIMVNCNPETVSTDYSSSDRLYFDELTIERLMDISQFEQSKEIIVSMGGQLPNKLAKNLYQCGFNLLGHQYQSIDLAEDRSKFSKLLDQLNIGQPRWVSVTDQKSLDEFIEEVSFPLLIRPSYVLSGAAMKVVYNRSLLDKYLQQAVHLSQEYPVVLSEFLEGARELEIDGVAKKGKILTNIISEHIENAGIHSGDATTVVPPQKLYVETARQVKRAARLIVEALNLNGPFNIQFLAKDNKIKVIECNARAARSFPFISKTVGLNLAKVATDVICDLPPKLNRYNEDELPFVGVKAAMFSFPRLKGADPVSGVEMASTGEVGCIGNSFHEAFLLALESSNLRFPQKGILISAGSEKEKLKFLESAKKLLKMNIPMFATQGTGDFLNKHQIPVTTLQWNDAGVNEVLGLIKRGEVDLVLNCPKSSTKEELSRGSLIRQTAVQFGCSLLTNVEKIIEFVQAFDEFGYEHKGIEVRSLPSFNE